MTLGHEGSVQPRLGVLATPAFDDADGDATADDVEYDTAEALRYDVLKLHVKVDDSDLLLSIEDTSLESDNT